MASVSSQSILDEVAAAFDDAKIKSHEGRGEILREFFGLIGAVRQENAQVLFRQASRLDDSIEGENAEEVDLAQERHIVHRILQLAMLVSRNLSATEARLDEIELAFKFLLIEVWPRSLLQTIKAELRNKKILPFLRGRQQIGHRGHHLRLKRRLGKIGY